MSDTKHASLFYQQMTTPQVAHVLHRSSSAVLTVKMGGLCYTVVYNLPSVLTSSQGY